MRQTSAPPVPQTGIAREPKPARPAEDVYVFPASFAQQRLWFLHELDPASSAYNLPILLRIEGPLDPDALERAFKEIVGRHETLRTTFAVTGGEPVQVIAPELRVALVRREVGGVPEAGLEEEALRLATVETRRPFDLRTGPLIRAHLWRLRGEDHVLLLNMHHAVADGWSFAVLLTELAELYAAFSRGAPSPLRPLPLQYADFAVWQRSLLTGDTLERKIAHWKTRLAGAPERLALPCDHPRRAPGSEGAVESRAFSGEIVDSVRRFSQREGATPFMTMLAAFALLLHRLTGERDLLIGTPIAGRMRPELEKLVGLFINTLTLRVDLSGNPTVRGLVARVRDVALDAYAHQDLPVEKLVEEMRPHRDPSRNPLFQVLFLHHRGFIQPFTAGPLRLTPMRVDRGGSGEDLSLFLIEREGEGLTAGVEYKTSLFQPETVRGLLAQYQTVVEGMLAGPDTPVSRVPIVPPDQRHRVLVEWNRTDAISPEESTIHRLFERQVARSPDAEALVCGGARLTYRELNERANRAARFLRRQGVGSERLVGICLDRSIELVVAILAVLKAGGAYVPLDPSYPPERLALLQSDAAAELVLSRRAIAKRVGFPSARVLLLDDETEAIGWEASENLPERSLPEGLAYVLYTSGSTGGPKGVGISHRSLAHSTAARLARYDGPVRSFLLLSSVAFDSSIAGLFGTLCRGATLHLPEEGEQLDPRLLGQIIASRQITHTLCVPSLYAQLLEQARPGDLDSLECLVLAGEAFPEELIVRHRRHLPRTRLFNEYGPTECTVWSTVHEFAQEEETQSRVIGRPVAGARIYLLDAAGEPVPVGIPGQIHVGGALLARGYWNGPAATAERFVPDPFSSDPGQRLYQTGDLGKFLADGRLLFLGRADDQVKVRGQRVEPGEVEAVIARHPKVREVAVLARPQSSGGPRLVAYTVLEGDPPPDVRELRHYLKDRLPDAMIPSAFVAMEALPRSPNGKVDRAALPAPAAVESAAPQPGHLPARDDVEARILAIWEKVLAVHPVGVRDNFFDLGGHSFLAMIAFSEMEKAFGKRMPLATLFQAPTVEEIAALLRNEAAVQAWSALVPISPAGSKPPFYCVHAVGGNVLTYADLARRLGPDQPVYGVQAVGLEGLRPPHATLEEMARHYAAEILRFQPQGPYALGGTSAGGLIAYEVARHIEAAGGRVALLALFDTYAPGSVRRRPGVSSLRLQLYRIADRFLLHFQNFLAAERMGKAAYIAAKSRRLGNQLRYRWRRVRQIPLSPPLQRVDEAVRAAIRGYVPGPYGGRVTLFRATSGPSGYEVDPTLGWSRLAVKGVEVLELPGRHGALVYEPRVGPLAKKLRACLDAAFGGVGADASVSSSARSA